MCATRKREVTESFDADDDSANELAVVAVPDAELAVVAIGDDEPVVAGEFDSINRGLLTMPDRTQSHDGTAR